MKISTKKPLFVTAMLLLLLVTITACANDDHTLNKGTAGAKSDQAIQSSQTAKPGVEKIASVAQFDNVVAAAGDTLLMVDLYADWCAPCRQLAPILENVAEEKESEVKTYKVNVDELRALAVRYNVRGIPYVVFIKNGEMVTSLTGLRNKAAYVSIIDQYSTKPTS